jgi:CBS domain-containing protein
MPITDFCNTPVVTISPDQQVLKAVKLMRNKNVGAVVITAQEKPVGILTDRDVVMRVTAEGREASTTRVRDVMTPNPVVISEEEGIWELIQIMKEHGKRRYPVVSGKGKLVGIITLDDLIALIGVEMSGLSQAISSELGYTALL